MKIFVKTYEPEEYEREVFERENLHTLAQESVLGSATSTHNPLIKLLLTLLIPSIILSILRLTDDTSCILSILVILIICLGYSRGLYKTIVSQTPVSTTRRYRTGTINSRNSSVSARNRVETLHSKQSRNQVAKAI